MTGPDDPRYGVPRPPMSIDAGRPGHPATTGSIPHGTIAALPPEDQPEVGKPKELPPQFRRQVVDYKTKEPAGTIIIDTPSTFLYYVNGDGTAIRYGIGVGRDGFTWAGTEKVTRMAEWPDWHPPSEMIERQPYLPRFMAGGESNPMGARALYLGKTIYRVHGTNQPSTIGQFVSSGCIRMLNDDVADLYTRVKVGTKVVVRGDGKGPRAPGTDRGPLEPRSRGDEAIRVRADPIVPGVAGHLRTLGRQRSDCLSAQVFVDPKYSHDALARIRKDSRMRSAVRRP